MDDFHFVVAIIEFPQFVLLDHYFSVDYKSVKTIICTRTMFKPADDLLKVHMQFAYRSCLFTLPSTILFKVTSYQVVKDLCFMTLKLWK